MKLTTDQVKKVAKLADLPISEEELPVYSEQLSAILDYIDKLNEVDTKDVEPTFNVSLNKTSLEESSEVEPQKSLSQEEALSNAPSSKNGYFVTKGVFEEE